jgi:drug/metabolite transporter (DMT)-like permease
MKTLRPHLFVLAANLIYGANYSIAKKAMPEFIQPLGFVLVRVVFACALFWLSAAFIKEKEKLRKKDYLRLALCGLFGVAVNQLLFFAGLNITTPINAALMMTTNPVLVLLMAHFLIREKISFSKTAGIVLALSGASCLILYGGKTSFSGQSAWGDFMVLINSFSFAVFLVIAKPLMMRFHPFTVMKWTFLFGTVPVLFFGMHEMINARWHDMTLNIWLAVIYVVLATTFLAYAFNIFALRQLDASQVSVYIYLQPLFAAMFSVLFGEGLPQWIHLFTGLMIFTGIRLTLLKKSISA